MGTLSALTIYQFYLLIVIQAYKILIYLPLQTQRKINMNTSLFNFCVTAILFSSTLLFGR